MKTQSMYFMGYDTKMCFVKRPSVLVRDEQSDDPDLSVVPMGVGIDHEGSFVHRPLVFKKTTKTDVSLATYIRTRNKASDTSVEKEDAVEKDA